MSVYAAPDAVGPMGPPPGGPPMGGPPAPGDPGSMAALAAALQGGLPGSALPPGGPPPPDGAALDPALLAGLGGGGPGPGDLGAGPDLGGGPGPDQGGSDLLSGMSSTEHIRAAIKHLMMAMTESTDDTESHGITKGMAALHGILAGKQKNQQTIAAAGG